MVPSEIPPSDPPATPPSDLSAHVKRPLEPMRALARVRQILLEDLDERPEDLLAPFEEPRFLVEVIRDIVDLFRTSEARQPSNIHLLKERAILTVGSILWGLKQRSALPVPEKLSTLLQDLSDSPDTQLKMLSVIQDASLLDNESHFLAYINQFLEAVNQQEMIDFRLAKIDLLAQVARKASRDLRFENPSSTYGVRCPMRVGISSANASDNWTFSKLRGGVVLNFALDLSASGQSPRPPLSATIATTSESGIELQTISLLQTDRPTRCKIEAKNYLEFFALAPELPVNFESCFKDIHDPLLMLKYSLVFAGIVGFSEDPERYLASPSPLFDDIARFAGGRGLRLTVECTGPSRSATQSLFDEAARCKVLRVPFEHLLERGLIHGGMYTGAMGGGCMMLVPTELGKTHGSQGKTRLVEELELLREFRAGELWPFEHLVVYDYAVNTRGLEYVEPGNICGTANLDPS